MAFIAKSTIQEVKDRLDAISVVGEYVRLENKGGRWWGRCPFHAGGQEKTPSFKVDPDYKTYHCFGCGKGDSVIGFVMEMDKITYPEAIKNLARKMGIEIIYEDGETGDKEKYDYSKKDELYELYRRITGMFRHFLCEKEEGKKALNYIKQRGISDEIIERFKLGYAPDDRRFLYNFLKTKGYSEEFLDKTGLFSSRNKSYPLFSGRLMFPISDRQSRVVAFGGRAMPGVLQSDGSEPPKYINSPETDIYTKGQTLYALDLALPEIRKTKTVYLAEGYIDVISLHQAGITNAVAQLGTSFTGEQASLLRRWADKVILLFDEDKAGQNASYKAIITCRKNGLSCSLVRLQESLKKEINTGDAENYKDPADIFQKFGAEILKKIMNCTINDFEYLIARSNNRGADGGSNRSIVSFMFPFLDALESEIERDEYISLTADAFLLEKNAVRDDYFRRRKGTDRSRAAGAEEKKRNMPIRMNAELRLLTNVAVNMTLYPEFRSAIEIKEIDDPAAKELFIAMEECFIHDECDTDSLLARIKDDSLKQFIVSCGMSHEFTGKDSRIVMEDGINKVIVRKRIKKRLLEIGAELRKYERSAEADANDADNIYIDDLLSEKMYLDSQMRKLDGKV